MRLKVLHLARNPALEVAGVKERDRPDAAAPSTSDAQNASRPFPLGANTPNPVITTRLRTDPPSLALPGAQF